MWLTRVTHYLLRNTWQSLLIIFLIAFVPVIGVVAIVLAALITLLKGSIEGLLATLAATIPYLIIFLIYRQGETHIPLHIWASLGVAVTSNLLTWVFAVILNRGSTWSNLLQVAALLGVFAISLLHYAYPDIADWLFKILQDYYNQASTMSAKRASISPDSQLEVLAVTKQFATGFMTAAILTNSIMQLIVARWWQATVFNPKLLRRELHNIRLSPLAGVLFLACMLFSYLGNAVVLDIIPVVYLLFFAAGLSIIHYFFGLMSSQTTWFWLLILYFAILFSVPTSIVLVSLIALIDVWWNARIRFKQA